MTERSDPLSIFYITQYFPPETGAPATRVQELTSRWADSGHDVTVLTSAPDYPEGELFDGYDKRWLQIEERDGVRVVMTKTIPASSAQTIRRMFKFILFMIAATIAGLWLDDDPDVAIATSPQPLIGLSALVIGWLRDANVVFEVRDLWPETIETVGEFDNNLALWLLERVVRIIYERADRVAMVTQGFEDSLLDYGVDAEDLWYHPNGVDLEYFETHRNVSELDEEVRSVFENHFVICYAGTIGRTHGLVVCLDAAESLRDLGDVRFVLVGYGSELKRLRSMAEKRDLDNVVFVGRRPKTDIPKVLGLSDIALVHLKDRELFRTVIPSKMFEAMGAGVPIALGVDGEARRILEAGEAGLSFEPENADELVEVVTRLYEDPELRRRLGENGKQFVAEEFSWASIANEYRTNLESLV